MVSPCLEVRDLYRLRQKYNLSRDLVSSITKIPPQNIYRYEMKGIIPIRPYRDKIRLFVETLYEIEKEGSK